MQGRTNGNDQYDSGLYSLVGCASRPPEPASARDCVQPVSAPRLAFGRFVGSIGSLLFSFAVTNTLFMAILMQHLAPHQQATFQTPVQTLGQVGRGIGPYLGTLLIQRGDQIAVGLGPRLMLVMSCCAITSSVILPSLFGGRFYDLPQVALAREQQDRRLSLQ